LLNIHKIFALLSLQERRQAMVLLAMIFVMALIDVLGVASIMPFMAVLSNPQLVESNAWLNEFYLAAHRFGIATHHDFLLILGFCVFIFLMLSLAFKALTTYLQLRFTLMREYSIGRRLVEGYLRQPYPWFFSRHSADLGKTVLNEVHQVVDTTLIPAMNLIVHGTVASALMLLLILVDPMLALTISFVMGSVYLFIFKISSRLLAKIGAERISANSKRFMVLSEAFGAIKELKVGSLEQTYIERFDAPAKIYAKHEATARAIGQLPRFALEAMAFGGMLLVTLYLISINGSFAPALPVIALYAFTGYRLMPALQYIYISLTQLRYSGASLEAVYLDLINLQEKSNSFLSAGGADQLKFNSHISLSNISYRYPGSSRLAVNGISLTIPVSAKVGLVGTTGSGKTTIIDLIMRLLDQESGALDVDSIVIDKSNQRAWQKMIGYVPQQIYLVDDTIAANIAFGIDYKDIDQAAVERAAKIANLHDFVTSHLPNKYATIVGERGVRFSGGQRQRIGIARALYSNPRLLILDEATSALDNITEQIVMEAIHNLGDSITIILVAHRLSTVKECDTIFLIDEGKVEAQGNFEELTKTNKRFSSMAAHN
jgi:ATP-binding cassette, subfamily B, bacterial PglK